MNPFPLLVRLNRQIFQFNLMLKRWILIRIHQIFSVCRCDGVQFMILRLGRNVFRSKNIILFKTKYNPTNLFLFYKMKLGYYGLNCNKNAPPTTTNINDIIFPMSKIYSQITAKADS
jgi:hypothetical protein